MAEREKIYKSGLTAVSALAIAYVALALTPAVIYMSLVTGLGLGGLAYVTLLLFSEVGRLVGRYVTLQEAMIVYYMSGVAAADALYWVGLLTNLYYREAPYTKLFGIAGKIPTWAAPPLDSWAVQARTFFAKEWLTPILVSLIGTTASILVDIGLSLIFVRLYVEEEKLPFPMAAVSAEAISVLIERPPDRMVAFTLSGAVAFIYTLVLYGLPQLTEALMGVRIQLVSIPFVDLTPLAAGALPGAILGVTADLSTFIVGMILPWIHVVWLLIGSLSFFVVGNSLGIALADVVKHPMLLRWRADWSPTATLDWLWQRSVYDLWASPFIGLTVGVSLFSLAVSAKYIKPAIASLRRLGATSRETYVPLGAIVAMTLGGALAGAALSAWLYPSLWWLWLLLWTAFPFLQGVLSSRSVGEAGLGVQIPYVREAFIMAFTEPGDVAAWMVPTKVTTGASGIVSIIKVATLLEVRPLDYYKAYAITLPLALLFSFIYLQIFWSIAPIPSAAYPWTVISWPVGSLGFSMWVSRSIEVFKPDLILFSAAAILAASLIARKLNLPFSPIGFSIGTSTLPPFAINYFVGALIGRFMERRLGRRWNEMKVAIAAGTSLGAGLALVIVASFVMLAKSVWFLPF
jgi:hypothetical protein